MATFRAILKTFISVSKTLSYSSSSFSFVITLSETLKPCFIHDLCDNYWDYKFLLIIH